MIPIPAPRVAREATVARNVEKTLVQIAAMWTVFYLALPTLVLRAEDALAVSRFDLAALRPAAAAAFAGFGVCGVAMGLHLAMRGGGTPLPYDATRRLVIEGPYRYVRNPMTIVSFGQGLAVAAWHGSPALFAYVVAGIVLWQRFARPWEERDLLARFGNAYALYRRRVRCWRVRLQPYRPESGYAEPPVAAERTTAPGRNLLLYDGRCRLCQAASERLVARAAPGTIARKSFRDPGVLEAFPGIPPAACERAIHLITPDGRVLSGAEAVAAALRTRPLLALPALLYHVPGVRLACDLVYDRVARNRLQRAGTAEPACAVGACRG